MVEGWRKRERKNAAGVRLWGDQKKNRSVREGNRVRQGADDDSLVRHDGVWVILILKVAGNPLTQSEIFSRRRVVRFLC